MHIDGCMLGDEAVPFQRCVVHTEGDHREREVSSRIGFSHPWNWLARESNSIRACRPAQEGSEMLNRRSPRFARLQAATVHSAKRSGIDLTFHF